MSIHRSEIDMTGFDVSRDPARQGTIELRWRKIEISDSGAEQNAGYHRMTISSEMDVDFMFDAVKTDLARQGYPWDVFESDCEFFTLLTNFIWTPEIVAARKAFIDAELTKLGSAALKQAGLDQKED